MSLNEADTCRIYVTPKLQASGWEQTPHSITEQKYFTAGRIELRGHSSKRKEGKKADYLLRYTRDFPMAVVEAKAEGETAGKGMQQAKDYAEILGLKFAYATNGHHIIEFDYITGLEQEVSEFPSPEALFTRLSNSTSLDAEKTKKLLAPSNLLKFSPRYYQEIAINRAVMAILLGRRRLLLTMATGTGKTVVAFQICWKLWSSRWNREGAHRKPRILFLADRNILIDDPKDKTFVAFGDARHKIQGAALKSREMYFATYQAIARDSNRPGLYRDYSRDFFDLIVIDECHRGSSRTDSSWREILEYFKPAFQLGMTATPLRDDNRDTYDYFGNPLYTYSLFQGIDDGFLAPYRVHRVITQADADGWRPDKGMLDRYGREIPDEKYYTKDFERKVVLLARTKAIARHLSDYLKRTDRFAKTIVFCVDQPHADEMRRQINNLNADLVRRYPNYVERVTSDEGNIGKGHLSDFQELETVAPVILTTSQLLTTGVDAPTCKNVVLARVVNSMSEFKQIIGRGTRMREDYGKTWFNIIDYTGSATTNFADPDFDGYPEAEDVTIIDDEGEAVIDDNNDENIIDDDNGDYVVRPDPVGSDEDNEDTTHLPPDPPPPPQRFYVDEGHIDIIGHVVYEMDADGKQLKVVQYTDYTKEQIRTLFTSMDALQDQWTDPVERAGIMDLLEDRGISYDKLTEITGHEDADPLDLLCHLAFDSPLRTRKQRADYLRKNNPDFFDQYGDEARAILQTLLGKYTEFGPAQLSIPGALEVAPISDHGNVIEIAELFGGVLPMKIAFDQMQSLLYTH